MQEWLKDKKNLPIIIGISAFVLIGAIVAFLFESGILPPQPAPGSVAVAPSSSPGPEGLSRPGGSPGIAPGPRVPPGAGGVPSPGEVPSAVPGPGAPRQALGAAATAATPPPAPVLNVAKGPDPFNVPGYHPYSNAQLTKALTNALRVRRLVPAIYIQQYTPKDQLLIKNKLGQKATTEFQLTPEVSSSMRMSGVVTTDNSIKALLESNGVSTQVQPGDTVAGGKVISIQPDGLLLRTSDNRLVRVPLSGTSTGGNSPYGGGNSPYGGGPPDNSQLGPAQ